MEVRKDEKKKLGLLGKGASPPWHSLEKRMLRGEKKRQGRGKSNQRPEKPSRRQKGGAKILNAAVQRRDCSNWKERDTRNHRE